MDEPFVLCDSPPLFILTKHNRIGAPSFSGLDQDITPLFPIESRSEVDGVAFSRMQVPISPGFAITDFKSQGISVDKGYCGYKDQPSQQPPSPAWCQPQTLYLLERPIGKDQIP